MGSRQSRHGLAGAFIAFGVASLLSLAFWFNLFSGWQESSSDFFFKARGLNPSAEKPHRVAIVAIDDKSLEELGRFASWPRSRYAELLDILQEARARVVAFDILFSEPSPEDTLLQEAMRRAGNVVQPLVGTPHSPTPARRGEAVAFERFLKPLPGFVEASVALGHANFLPGEDGAVRTVPLVIRSQGEEVPALALAATAVYLRRPPALEDGPNGTLLFAGRRVPVDDWQRMVISYVGRPSEPGKPSTFPTVPLVDVLRGQVQPDLFFDKMVLVGVMATGEPDSYITPVSSAGMKMFGVEIHANAIETILRADFLVHQDARSTIGTIFFLALVGGLLVPHLRPLWAAAAVAALGLLYLLASFIMFDRGLVPNLVYPPMGLAITFVAGTLHRIVTEEGRRREVLSLFGRYVSPEVQREILTQAEAGQLRLGGVRREVTVLFADLRGFTGISERLAPEAVVELLNTYLSAIIGVIFKHGGMVNKFAGDSLMAVWNAPTSQPDHALKAALAAAEIQQVVRAINGKNPQLPEVGFGVGVNTGEAVAGNVGSQDRMEYTFIGDTVNLAARLTGAAPGGDIWIGSDTYERVKHRIAAEALPGQRFKGKTGELTVYHVTQPLDPVGPL